MLLVHVTYGLHRCIEVHPGSDLINQVHVSPVLAPHLNDYKVAVVTVLKRCIYADQLGCYRRQHIIVLPPVTLKHVALLARRAPLIERVER
ncbi:hypothetical protein D3C77_566690 [compost metagenome]